MVAALRRIRAIYERRPEAAMHDDATATAHWSGGSRVESHHPAGHRVVTDLPVEWGGGGAEVSPGWLFRAGLASCAATSIVMLAASEDVQLSLLEVRADSRSDARGMLGMHGADGQVVEAGPADLRLHVRIAAPSANAERLRALVEAALRQSPVPRAAQTGTAMTLDVEIGAG